MDHHGWSERRACSAIGLSRSTARYRRRLDRDEEVIALLAELAERFPERGFDKLFQLIRRRGLVWNHKRVWRVYCLMQLNRRRRGKKRVPNRHPMPLVPGEQTNSSWSIDFMSDALWDGPSMARFVFGLNVSLDGFVDHQAFGPPDPLLFHHFTGQLRSLAGMVYGRGMYEVMRYWDDDHPEWGADERDYAAAWRGQPKWVLSRSLESVGPRATLVADSIEAAMRQLKAGHDGEIEVAGPGLARCLGDLGLIDAYRLYLHPVVLGHGKPFFAGPRSRLRLVASEVIIENVVRLTYVPA